MSAQKVLRWREGQGWLVLSGGVDHGSHIRALVLQRATAEGGVAYISLNATAESAALDDMEDLGAPTGYLVDVLAEDDQTVRTRLAEAGIIVIEDTTSLESLRSGLFGAAVEGMQAAFERGAIILAEGAGAAVMGAWVLRESGQLAVGLKWLENALIVPGMTSLAESPAARAALVSEPTALALGIGIGSALALGPDGLIETWGKRAIIITLGRSYQPPA